MLDLLYMKLSLPKLGIAEGRIVNNNEAVAEQGNAIIHLPKGGKDLWRKSANLENRSLRQDLVFCSIDDT